MLVWKLKLTEHQKNRYYKCPICDIKFAENITLNGHISSEHEKNKYYKCPICVVIFAVNIKLKGHISSEHEKNKSYKCPICDAKFAENISLKGHISSEDEKNKSYNCPNCVEIFAVNTTLKGYISSEHEKNESYKCPVCKVKFAAVKRKRPSTHAHRVYPEREKCNQKNPTTQQGKRPNHDIRIGRRGQAWAGSGWHTNPTSTPGRPRELRIRATRKAQAHVRM